MVNGTFPPDETRGPLSHPNSKPDIFEFSELVVNCAVIWEDASFGNQIRDNITKVFLHCKTISYILLHQFFSALSLSPIWFAVLGNETFYFIAFLFVSTIVFMIATFFLRGNVIDGESLGSSQNKSNCRIL